MKLTSEHREEVLNEIGGLLRGNVLAITGAGISVASGLPTFRGQGGLYEGLNPYELATMEAFRSRTVTVWNWYLMRIHQGKGAQPNPAHLALAELEDVARKVSIITSNVDPLHQRAGSTNIFRLHGDILQTKCLSCERVFPLSLEGLPETYTEETLPRCKCGGLLRPNVVWFGESPWREAFEAMERELPSADVVLEVGVSGYVTYGFSQLAARLDKPVVRINPEPEEERGILSLSEPAEELLPELVARAASSR